MPCTYEVPGTFGQPKLMSNEFSMGGTRGVLLRILLTEKMKGKKIAGWVFNPLEKKCSSIISFKAAFVHVFSSSAHSLNHAVRQKFCKLGIC